MGMVIQMERLTDIDPATAEPWRTANGVSLGDNAAPGTNLVAGDHVQLARWLPIEVYGPSPNAEGCFNGGYEPYFGPEPMIFVLGDITDRCGPNGETMPIYDDEPDVEEEVP
jgi:hypothetical protein